MVKERAKLSLDDDNDILDIVSKKQTKSQADVNDIKEIATQSGFTSREPTPAAETISVNTSRRRRRSTPYSSQLGIRVRPEMKELFQDISDYLLCNDCTTFEKAIIALAEKEGNKDFIDRYQKIINRN